MKASWKTFKTLVATTDLPGLGSEPRTSRKSLSELDPLVERFLTDVGVARPVQPALRAAALLWHDYLDESHRISQGIGTPDGSFLHGIMHRREPDYGNAKYWFHRVGVHPCFRAIAEQSGHFLSEREESSLVTQLIPGGRWDAFAFIDACEAAAPLPPGDRRVQSLRRLQEIEFDCLLFHLLGA